jgi:hypothetical protein
VLDRERGYQATQLARPQQMRARGRAPASLALGLEKGLHHEKTTGRYELDDPRHAGSVKIIEYQNRIKNPEIGPLTLEIQFPPVDG